MNKKSSIAPEQRTGRIRSLNDQFRTTLQGGTVLLTSGIVALGHDKEACILEAVRSFNGFTRDNDPYDEHDFGSVLVNDELIYFKIDYYDQVRAAHSPDASDPDVTERVMTIMLACEY